MFDDDLGTNPSRQQRPNVGGRRRHEATDDRDRGLEVIKRKEEHVLSPHIRGPTLRRPAHRRFQESDPKCAALVNLTLIRDMLGIGGVMDEVNNQIISRPGRCAVVGSWSVELLPRNPYRAAYRPDVPVVGFAFEGQTGMHAFGNDRKTDFRTKPNSLAFVPAGCDVYSASNQGGEYLRLTFERLRDETWSWSRRFSDEIDPLAIFAAEQLRRQLLAVDGADELQCERFVEMLKQRTASVLSETSTRPAARSWMTPRRLRLIEDLIEARLDTKMTVQGLADELELSGGFFCRAFHAAVGKAPHDYIIDRRVSRARMLLRDGSLGLSAVAHASGFSSHAHMTATFRKRLGVAPSDKVLRSVGSKGRSIVLASEHTIVGAVH
jgi:AraC family transcriptional regulator